MAVSLPPKPEKPLDSDCCGNGCKSCVFDIYEEELRIWEDECQRILNADLLKNDGEVEISPKQYNKFKIIDIKSLNNCTKIYRFALARGKCLQLKPGQHLMLRVLSNAELVTRPYTPISSANAAGYFDVIIKIYNCGKASKEIQLWNIGQYIDWRGPIGEFHLKTNTKYLIMFAAGTGLTPFMNIINSIVENEDQECIVNLLFSCRDFDGILLKHELEKFQCYWNFHCTYILSQETDKTKARYGDDVHYGRLNRELLLEKVEKFVNESYFLICGPNVYCTDVLKYLIDLGASENQCYCF